MQRSVKRETAVAKAWAWLGGGNKVVAKTLNYHFVGIGGCGMSGLAQVLAQAGQGVSGSDMTDSAVVGRLRDMGVSVGIGHGLENLPERVDKLVVSAAIKADNPEFKWALERGIKVYKYAELLGELSGQMMTLAVAGTHGKSTTSGWLGYVLQQAGAEPSYVIGAEVEQLGGGSGAGAGEHLVVEACEYDRSFLNLQPAVAVLLNIEADHLDYYSDLAEIIGAFKDFADCTRQDGLVVANADDANVVAALAEYKGKVETFALKVGADWEARNLEYVRGAGRYDLVYKGDLLGRVELTLPGEHNVYNSLATAAAAYAAGVERQALISGLAGYRGAGRRMTHVATVNGVVVMDDYAHHPTEIRASLRAMRDAYEPGRLWCVFQPHQYSRTRFFLNEFALSFGTADVILLPEIYFVRDSEALRQEVNAQKLAEQIVLQGGDARYMGSFDEIADTIYNEVEAGDMVVTMGAGDIWKLGDEIIRRLERHS